MKFPKPLKITSRTSSITNSFVQAIIPSVEPTQQEVAEALNVLGMTPDNISCVYCGSGATDWDHLRPLVRKKQPTGYINEMRNLVPSCGPCNQSKSGADWQTWMKGSAKGSPRAKKVADLDRRIERIERYVGWGNAEPLPFRELAGKEKWDAYWRNLETIEMAMRKAQTHAVAVQAEIRQALEERRRSNPPIKFNPSSAVGDDLGE